jgi:hypothetical protein
MPSKAWKSLLVILSAVVVIVGAGIGYWKRAALPRVNPYVPVIIPSLIAASQIRFKDWNSYNPRSIRYLLLLTVSIACGWGILSQNQQIRDRATATARADASQAAQQDNTKQFLAHLGTLSEKITNLETRVATACLQKDLAEVRGELQRTQKTMAPAPLVPLQFSFFPFTNPPYPQKAVPSTDVVLPVSADGTVRVQFTVLNMSELAALDGELTLQICDQCKFAKEPDGFQHLPGQQDTHRTVKFDRILGTTAVATMTADITVPPNVASFPMGILPRCRNCVILHEPSKGSVRLTRPLCKKIREARALPDKSIWQRAKTIWFSHTSSGAGNSFYCAPGICTSALAEEWFRRAPDWPWQSSDSFYGVAAST